MVVTEKTTNVDENGNKNLHPCTRKWNVNYHSGICRLKKRSSFLNHSEVYLRKESRIKLFDVLLTTNK